MTFTDVLTYTEWQPLLWHCAPGAELSDVDGRLRVFRSELAISIGERHGLWRARERRGLHRLGFRAIASRGHRVWTWTLSFDDLRAAAQVHPMLSGEGPRTRAHERLAWSFSREQLMREQLMRVLADVFGFEPGELCLELPEGDWDEAEEDVQAS